MLAAGLITGRKRQAIAGNQMSEFFPTIHSVLDNEAVAGACAEQYGFSEQPYCELIHRGMNDVYLLRTKEQRYAVRAWRAHWRSMDDVAYELEFLRFLKDEGLPVVPGLPCRSGRHHFVVEAPEGPRALAAFEWVPGEKFVEKLDAKLAARLGATLADIHRVGGGFRPRRARRTNPPELIAAQFPYLERMMMDRSEDLRFYRQLAPRLIDALKEVDSVAVPMGACHGDFHFNNGLIDRAGNITFLDFDNSGLDHYVHDVMCVCWAVDFMGLDSVYGDAFVNGYQSRRSFSPAERDCFSLFVLAKEFRLLTGYAKHINSLGHYLHKYRDLDWFSSSIRKHAREAGLV